MACCGKQRTNFQGAMRGNQPLASPGAILTGHHQVLRSKAFFEYLGHTGLTVIGPVTGRRYRFNHYGAVIEVDLRDRPSMAAVPKLRQI